MTDEKKTLPKPVRTALERIERSRAFVLRHAEAARIAEEAIDWFGKTLSHDEGEAKGSLRLRVSLGWEAGSLKGVLVFVNLLDLRKAVPLLRRIRAKGFKIEKREDYEEMSRRTYEMRRDGDSGAEYICVCVFLMKGEGAVCEYVQVGVKEEPVYELRCGDNGKDPGIEAEVESGGVKGGIRALLDETRAACREKEAPRG